MPITYRYENKTNRCNYNALLRHTGKFPNAAASFWQYPKIGKQDRRPKSKVE